MCHRSLGTAEAAWTSFTGTAAHNRAMVCVTTVNCGATSGGGAGYFFSSAGLIACKDVGFFEAFSCPWTPSPTFYKLLEIERIFFSARGTSGLTYYKGCASAHVETPPCIFGHVDVSSSATHWQHGWRLAPHQESKAPPLPVGKLQKRLAHKAYDAYLSLGLHCADEAAERGAIDEVPSSARSATGTPPRPYSDLDAQHRRHDDLGDKPYEPTAQSIPCWTGGPAKAPGRQPYIPQREDHTR